MSIILEFMHMQEHLSVTCIDTYIVINKDSFYLRLAIYQYYVWNVHCGYSYTYVLLIFTKQNNKG